ncbi:MAG: DUF1697 domain-containing protein [Salana multivorans]|uniref:DUF1697 domain-containing protein n=1 Tax=Salana multivorans TaxID=120377 RepID=UPI00096262F1|nr:DUF1697 domain-containing protein [Salana multivorans]MBN8880749.1 DUF1697 domain-containing protein [Salana multivorans]OJX96901.1 MAG: hypothetical protein BGO96_02145 [Micrococcales bacterium 73-15]
MTPPPAERRRWAALVRGVGGPTAMRMPDLRAALERAGLSGVTTLQVAGNVVVDPDGRRPEEIAALVNATVRDAFGHDLPVLVRTHEQLLDLAARNPYAGSHEGRWVLTMALDRAIDDVTAAAVAEAAARRSPADALTVDGREVFVRYEGGVATSRLQGTWIERRLGAVGTARNHNTIERLIALTA